MNKKVFSFILAGLMASTAGIAAAEGPFKEFRQQQREKMKAHYEQQRKENQEFRQTLKDLPEEQWQKVITEHYQTQFQENKDFHAKRHEERMVGLRTKLDKKEKLNESKKAEILGFAEADYQEGVNFRQKQYQENLAFIESLTNNTGLSREQKWDALKSHMQDQKEEKKEFHQGQKEKRRTKRQEMRSSMKKGGGA